MEGRLGHFLEDLAVEQFSLLGDEAQVAQRMIGFDAERPDLRATDDWFRFFNYRHGRKVSLGGVGAQVHFPVVNSPFVPQVNRGGTGCYFHNQFRRVAKEGVFVLVSLLLALARSGRDVGWISQQNPDGQS